MPATVFIDGPQELEAFYAGVADDIRAVSFLPFMESELDKLADWERELFKQQVSPDGTPWLENAPSTIQRKGHSQVLRGIPQKPLPKRKGHKTPRRFERFRLSRSLTEKSRSSTHDAIRETVESSNGASLSFGTTVPYSVFHDRGTSRILARRHVGINGSYLDEMCERAADYSMKQLAKG